MEPQGRSVSPLRTRKRSWTLGPSKTTLGSRSGRSNGWAECREKNVGIGPTGRFFLLTFPLIGQCYRVSKERFARDTFKASREARRRTDRPVLREPRVGGAGGGSSYRRWTLLANRRASRWLCLAIAG